MTKDVVDGGWAFPQPIATRESGARDFSDEYDRGGMTLRDWFAGQAMHNLAPSYVDEIAARAYQLADAMLKARKQ